jgi:hypothetical protein
MMSDEVKLFSRSFRCLCWPNFPFNISIHEKIFFFRFTWELHQCALLSYDNNLMLTFVKASERVLYGKKRWRWLSKDEKQMSLCFQLEILRHLKAIRIIVVCVGRAWHYFVLNFEWNVHYSHGLWTLTKPIELSPSIDKINLLIDFRAIFWQFLILKLISIPWRIIAIKAISSRRISF